MVIYRINSVKSGTTTVREQHSPPKRGARVTYSDAPGRSAGQDSVPD